MRDFLSGVLGFYDNNLEAYLAFRDSAAVFNFCWGAEAVGGDIFRFLGSALL